MCPIRRLHRAISALRECWFAVDQGRGVGFFPVGGLEVVDGMADVGCEIAVCWKMFRVNSRVISGLFGGPVDRFIVRSAAVSQGPHKEYVEVGKSADEV